MIFFLFHIRVLFLDTLLLLRKQRSSAKSVCVPQLHIFSIWGKKKKIFLSLLLTYGVCHINHWWRTCSGIHVIWVTGLFYIASVFQIHAFPSYKAQTFYLEISQFFQRRAVFCQVFSSERCKNVTNDPQVIIQVLQHAVFLQLV